MNHSVWTLALLLGGGLASVGFGLWCLRQVFRRHPVDGGLRVPRSSDEKH